MLTTTRTSQHGNLVGLNLIFWQELFFSKIKKNNQFDWAAHFWLIFISIVERIPINMYLKTYIMEGKNGKAH